MNLTEEERKLVGFALACYIEDAEKFARKRGFGKDHMYCARLAQVQRLVYTKIIPEALCGDDTLADGSVLKKQA